MNLVDFLAWEKQQTERYEFLRGKTFAVAEGIARCNRVILNLTSRVVDHLDGTACQVFAQSMKVQIPDGVLYPDVVVTCEKAEAGDEQIVIAPKLIVEVLSRSATGHDKQDKFFLYRTLASLREYIVVDPVMRRVEVFTLVEGGVWMSKEQTTGFLTLVCIDFKLGMELLFKGLEGKTQ